MSGRRVPAWTLAEPGYRNSEYVLIPDASHLSGFRQVHRLTPIWVER